MASETPPYMTTASRISCVGWNAGRGDTSTFSPAPSFVPIAPSLPPQLEVGGAYIKPRSGARLPVVRPAARRSRPASADREDGVVRAGLEALDRLQDPVEVLLEARIGAPALGVLDARPRPEADVPAPVCVVAQQRAVRCEAALDRPLAERLPGAHELVLAPLLHRPDAEGVDAHDAIVADGPARTGLYSPGGTAPRRAGLAPRLRRRRGRGARAGHPEAARRAPPAPRARRGPRRRPRDGNAAEGRVLRAAGLSGRPRRGRAGRRPARLVPALRPVTATRSSRCRPSGAASPGHRRPSARVRRGSARPPARRRPAASRPGTP